MSNATLPLVPHWIDGATVASFSGRTAPVFDPALGIATKQVGLADAGEIVPRVAGPLPRSAPDDHLQVS